MDVAEHVWYLKNTCPIFGAIPEDDLAPLQALLTRTYYQPGETIYVAGEPLAHVYFVKVGRVRLAQRTEEGREVMLDFLDAGEVFGTFGGALGSVPRVCAIATEKTALCKIPREHFESFISRRPEVMFELTKVLDARLARVQVRIHQLLFTDLRGRILKTLEDLAVRYGEPVPDGIRLRMSLTHQEIATLIGSTREAVSPVVAKLCQTGILRYDARRPVLLVSATSLEAIAKPPMVGAPAI